MSKLIKLTDNTYLDSTSITHRKTLISKILDALQVEYVVDQGVTDGWTWRKWASGLAECWCNRACIGMAITTASGGTYYGDSKTFNYPSNLFKSLTNVMVTEGQGSHSSGVYPYQATNVSNTVSCTVEFRAFVSHNSANCPVYIHAYGKWK